MNIERNLFSLGLVALLALGASCSQDEAQPDTAVVGTTPLALTAIRVQTDDASAANGSLTRAPGTPDLSTAIPIGIFVKAGTTGEGYAAIHNRKAEYNTARKLWLPIISPATPDSIWLNNHEADIAVYAPYAVAQDAHQATNPGTLKLAAALRPVNGDKDLWGKRLKANNATYLTAPTVLAPTLTHLYTRLTVTLMRSATYTATATVSSLQLSGKDLCAEATYSLFADDETSAYSPTVAGSGFTATLTPALPIGTTVDAAAKIDLLLIPAALTEAIVLTATIDGVQMKVTLPAAKFASQLEAGKWYQTAINLKPGKLDIASVSVVKWDTSLAEVDGGQAEFDEEKLADYVIKNNDPVTIGTYTWAACNLRTSNAGDSNFEFEKEPWISGVYPGKKTDITADETNQCYWNWGCLKTPYDTQYLDGNVEWGSTEDETYGDPCAKIAPVNTWKVPSKAQLDDLSKTANRPGVGKTVWMNGEVFTVKSETGWVENTKNTIQGQVFVANGKAIFLPAASFRYSDGTMNAVGTDGYYWSRTPYTSRGYYLIFDSSNVYFDYIYRYFGFSVRCVQGTVAP